MSGSSGAAIGRFMQRTPPIGRLASAPLPAAVLLFTAYVLLSFLNSPGGYLGTDTGAKVATLDHMVENDTVRPTVGYWAAEWDPQGEYHPLVFTQRNDRGEWTNVTTLPMLVAGKPLYDLGGYRLALVLPMLGAVAAALACRDIARQLGDRRSGTRAFWIVGLGTPIAVYALDFWEHALGAGLMLWAWSALLRVVSGEDGLRWPVLAGVTLGASASMRTESFVVAFVAVAAVCGTLAFRTRLGAALRTGGITAVGFAVPWFANGAMESALGGRSRAGRASGAASRQFWSELSERGEEAAITWLSLPGFSYPRGVIAGGLVVMSILGAAAMQRREEPRAMRAFLLVAATLYVVVLAGAGLSFVSGALVATPVAVAALWTSPSGTRETLVLGAALTTTVLTWMYQYLGGAGPQWGGRYLLVPTLLLVCLGVVRLGSVHPVLAESLVAFSVVVTGFGVAWLAVRSHEVEESFDAFAQEPEDVIISTNGFLVREGGPAYQDRLYLSLSPDAELAGAVDIVDRAGFSTFGVLSHSDELPDVDATETSVERREFLGATLWYHRYELP